MRHCCYLLAFLSFLAWISYPSNSARAELLPSNVLVLYNVWSPEGTEVAQYYAQVHPGVRLLGLQGLGTDEEVSADYYLDTIRPQILGALDDSIDVIATTKGLPLRITTDPHTNLGTYVDPFGVKRPIFGTSWKPYSSLESELTRIDTFSTWEQLGDQTFWLPDDAPTWPHPTRNPYYRVNEPFDFETYGFRLVSRLDGFTVEDIKNSIDRAQNALVGPEQKPLGPFHFVLDDDPNAQGGYPVDGIELLRDKVLAPRGLPFQYDGTDEFVQDAPGSVLGYVSHGVHSGAPEDYLVDTENGLRFDLADGAVFHTWESFNAVSFDPSRSQNQGLIAEWISRGGTAGVGHVAEPLASVSNVTNEDELFRMLLDGYTWAEATWGSTRQLSYVNTMVGDPLMVFRSLLLGDANQDGQVNSADRAILIANWGKRGAAGGAMWQIGDFNSDGRVNSADMILLNVSLESFMGGSEATSMIGEASGLLEESWNVPEPSAFGLFVVGIVALAGQCWKRLSSRSAA